jgi:predicted dehydrogenase
MSRPQAPLRVAIVGSGFWARFQVRAWRQLEREGLVRLAALCGLDRAAVERLASSLQGPALPIYTDAGEMLEHIRDLHVVDIITTTNSHFPLAKLVLEHGVAAIVQKPMAQTLGQAIAIVRLARQAGAPLLVHENFRWQKAFVTLKQMIEESRDRLGRMIDLRVEYESGAEDYLRGQPYFAGQRFLVNGEVGVHLIDILRFLSDRNVTRITSAQMHKGVDPRYRGEDVVHVALDMQDGLTASYRVAFSAARSDERPPQTFARITFQRGTIELGPDYKITMILLDRNARGGIARQCETAIASPDGAEWTRDPALSDYQSWLAQWECCLPTNRAGAAVVLGETGAEARATTGENNLNVLAATFAAYVASMLDTRVEIPQSIEALEELARRFDKEKIGYPDFPTTESA